MECFFCSFFKIFRENKPKNPCNKLTSVNRSAEGIIAASFDKHTFSNNPYDDVRVIGKMT